MLSGVSEALVGPLAGPECRRALGRTWVLVVRGLALLPPAAVVLGVTWATWFASQFPTTYAPATALQVGLQLVEGMLLTAAMVLTPALLAGTLAGDKDRSTLVLLLVSAVSASEIVRARLAGRLCVIGMILLAGLPALVFLEALAGLGAVTLGLLVLLPAAVAFGAGGLAVAASAVARRGRDALLLIYLVQLALLLVPLFGRGLPAIVQECLEPFNPYRGVGPLVAGTEAAPALLTIGWWTFLGIAGICTAAGRLWPTYRRDAEGRRSRRRWLRRVPPMGERPLLWKERFFEQSQAFGRFVYWLGLLLVGLYLGASVVLAVVIGGSAWLPSGSLWEGWARVQLASLTKVSQPVCWLVQVSLGLRAAAAIAAERQRGTWDILLVTPLEGREIVGAKIRGGLYGLRGLVAAVLLAWTLAFLCGALTPVNYGKLVANALVVSGFMVVCGIACSLMCTTATRAMTLVVVAWLGAAMAVAMLAGILAAAVGIVVTIAWFAWSSWTGSFSSSAMVVGGPAVGVWFTGVFHFGRWGLYVLAALLVAAYCGRNFDRLAGRSFRAARRRYPRRIPQRPANRPQEIPNVQSGR